MFEKNGIQWHIDPFNMHSEHQRSAVNYEWVTSALSYPYTTPLTGQLRQRYRHRIKALSEFRLVRGNLIAEYSNQKVYPLLIAVVEDALVSVFEGNIITFSYSHFKRNLILKYRPLKRDLRIAQS
ncbi:hypothetical protein [Vibrio astriarenae]|uniref:hypothetical protein n=1 Tax=Vibrio astriarenae TaxID=1481923 RepID=UPI00373607B4